MCAATPARILVLLRRITPLGRYTGTPLPNECLTPNP